MGSIVDPGIRLYDCQTVRLSAMRRIALIVHNVRSCHNVGAIFRTADGLGVKQLYLTGYTPYPQLPNDTRLPHIAARAGKQISKTALGAEYTIAWQHQENIKQAIVDLRRHSYRIVALEQTLHSVSLPDYAVPQKAALIVGREVEGIEPDVLALADDVVAIPMLGRKESFNVAQAAAIALYHCRYAGSRLSGKP
jgi:23S rRNA (guanosine2251-2'-O)-methyltransferase